MTSHKSIPKPTDISLSYFSLHLSSVDSIWLCSNSSLNGRVVFNGRRVELLIIPALIFIGMAYVCYLNNYVISIAAIGLALNMLNQILTCVMCVVSEDTTEAIVFCALSQK